MSDVPGSLRRQLLEAERSRPLGGGQLASDRTLQPFSWALHASADNLLAKAMTAMEEGDDDRSRRYASRAAALDYDEREDVHPAVWSASVALFEEIVDDLEASDKGDHSWLTAALAVLEQAEGAEGAGGAGAVWLRHVLDTVAHDFELAPTEAKLIRRAVGKTGGEQPDFGLTRDSSSAAVGEVVLSILRVDLAYHQGRYH